MNNTELQKWINDFYGALYARQRNSMLEYVDSATNGLRLLRKIPQEVKDFYSGKITIDKLSNRLKFPALPQLNVLRDLSLIFEWEDFKKSLLISINSEIQYLESISKVNSKRVFNVLRKNPGSIQIIPQFDKKNCFSLDFGMSHKFTQKDNKGLHSIWTLHIKFYDENKILYALHNGINHDNRTGINPSFLFDGNTLIITDDTVINPDKSPFLLSSTTF